MDKDIAINLKDYQESIEKSFKKIDETITSLISNEKDKKSAMSSLKQELKKIENNVRLMKSEIQNLEDQDKKDLWNKKKFELKSKFETYSKMEDLTNINVKSEKVDHLDPNAKVNHEELTAQQEIERGDLIIEVDGTIIGRIKRTVEEDLTAMKEADEKLKGQGGTLEGADRGLIEINYSLERARNKITDMFKMYSKDKCIICLIVVILIIIVTIIIVSAFGGDNKNNFNVPHDVFLSNNITTNSSHYFIGSFYFMNLISLILLYLL
jgi:prophage DNA circulation protein